MTNEVFRESFSMPPPVAPKGKQLLALPHTARPHTGTLMGFLTRQTLILDTALISSDQRVLLNPAGTTLCRGCSLFHKSCVIASLISPTELSRTQSFSSKFNIHALQTYIFHS